MDLRFSLFDAEFYALFDDVIFGIGLCKKLRYVLFFLNVLGPAVANQINDSCKPPNCCTAVVL